MTEALNPEVFSLASQLYVRMRRCSGRVVDAIYMAKNEQYAQEILHIAAQEKDQEILEIVKRFEALLSKKAVEIFEPAADLPVVTDKVKPPEEITEKADIFSMTFRNLRRKVADLPTVEQLNGAAPPHMDNIEEEVAHHYTGALR
mgnify:CR=1 FL=1